MYNLPMKYYHYKQEFKKFFKLIAVLSLFQLLLSCAGGAKIASTGLGKASDPVPFMANARTGILPSGLRYYLLENSHPEGRAFLTLAVNAGSILETEEERGLAHFVEHMAFNGTSRFARSELIDYLRSLGMRFGPEVNAYTSFDATVYGIEVPVEKEPNGLKTIPLKALAVIDDWTSNITFNPDDVDSERLVILEEYRSHLGARERISREMYPVLFKGSLYAERLPIGLPAVIENAAPELLKGFYKKWYRPENMAVIIVGDFDGENLEKSLTEHFPLHKKTIDGTEPFYRPRINLSEPKNGSIKTLTITDSELSRSRVDLYWKRKAEVRRADIAYYRESIIDYLADTMLSLRFEEETIKSETPYVFAGAFMANFGFSSRFYAITAQAKPGAAESSLKELLTVKESLYRFGFTQDETDSAKASLISLMEQAVAEKNRQHSDYYISSFTSHFLTGNTIPDLEWELEAIVKLLPGITLGEINKRVKSYFLDNDLTVIVTAPDEEKENLPSDSRIKALAAETKRAKMSPPLRSRTEGELLAVIPESGAVTAEAIDSETGALRWTLSNGAEVIIKETKNKNSEISLYALARGGTLSAPEAMDVSAYLAAEMLSASGLGYFSGPELTKILLDKQVSLSFWTQSYLRGFQGNAAAKDIKTLFEMLYLNFTQPRFDPDAVKALLDQRRSNMAFLENDPNAVFRREITRSIYGNTRFHPLELSDLDKAAADESLTFLRTCLNPGDYTFVFTGNVDIPLLRSLAENYLASIPVSAALNEWADVDPLRPSGITKEVHKGKEERSAVYLSWFKSRPYTEKYSAGVSALNEYLEIILNDEIRQTLGGVYSISSWVSITPIPKGELSGGVYFMCDPKRAAELIAAVKGEFKKIASGEIKRDVLDKAIEALIREQEESVQRNIFIAQSYANSAVIFRSKLSRLDERPALYRAVSQADIQLAAAELLSGGDVSLILFPE
jgi:zinc protease